MDRLTRDMLLTLAVVVPAVLAILALPLPAWQLGLLCALVSAAVPLLLLMMCHRRARQLAGRSELFTAAFDAGTVPALILDEHACVIAANRAWGELFAVDPEQLLGQAVGEALPPAWLEHFKLDERGHLPVQERPHETRHTTITDASGLHVALSSHPIVIAGRHHLLTCCEDLRAHDEFICDQQARTARAQSFMQSLIDVIQQPVYLRDADSRFLMVNKAYVEHFKRSAAEIVGHTPGELLEDAEFAEDMTREDREVIAGRPVFKEVLSRLPVAGSHRNLVVAKACCQDPDGRPIIVGTYFDVTNWRKAEQALQAALTRELARHERVRQYVQRLIDVIPQPVYVKDAQSRYVLVNDAFCKERGRSKEDLVGQVSHALTADRQFGASIALEDAEVLAGRVILKEEHVPHMYTGKERFRMISKGSCLDAEGNPVIVGANFDITRWRQAERDLQAALARETERRKRTQEYVQRLIDVIPHPVYVKDARSRYLLVNEAFAIDRGRPKAELVGDLSVGQVVGSPFNQKVLNEDAEVLAGRFILKEEHKPHPFTGKERFRVVAKGSCLDAEGEPVIVCAIFDVTDWRLAEARWMKAKEEAERANEAKSLFLANMSHELRTPMHAILSFSRLGEMRTREDQAHEKVHGYFDHIVHSGERLLALLNDLLDLSKLEANGSSGKQRRPVDLRLLAQETLTEMSLLFDAKHISAELEIGTERLVLGDSMQLGQVLRNLLSNAIKFSPERSVVTLSLTNFEAREEATDEHDVIITQMVELRVADRGIGIPEDELERVFDKFVQSSKTHNGAGGTGLGLAICREIVGGHHGRIFARNRAGGGAELVVRLPAADEARPTSREAAPPQKANTASTSAPEA